MTNADHTEELEATKEETRTPLEESKSITEESKAVHHSLSVKQTSFKSSNEMEDSDSKELDVGDQAASSHMIDLVSIRESLTAQKVVK